jgi:hypothetical protein
MNKEEVLKNLFKLSQNEILDIFEILNGYKVRIKKSKKDTYLMRQVFANGYHNMNEYYKDFNITKDNSLASILNYDSKNIKDYITLKNKLNLNMEDIEIIMQEIEELGWNNEDNK